MGNAEEVLELIRRLRHTPPELKQRIRDFHALAPTERKDAPCVNCARGRDWEGDRGQALCSECAPAYKLGRYLHHRTRAG